MDEILITEEPAFDEYLNHTLQFINGNLLPFIGVSIVVQDSTICVHGDKHDFHDFSCYCQTDGCC